MRCRLYALSYRKYASFSLQSYFNLNGIIKRILKYKCLEKIYHKGYLDGLSYQNLTTVIEEKHDFYVKNFILCF